MRLLDRISRRGALRASLALLGWTTALPTLVTLAEQTEPESCYCEATRCGNCKDRERTRVPGWDCPCCNPDVRPEPGCGGPEGWGQFHHNNLICMACGFDGTGPFDSWGEWNWDCWDAVNRA